MRKDNNPWMNLFLGSMRNMSPINEKTNAAIIVIL